MKLQFPHLGCGHRYSVLGHPTSHVITSTGHIVEKEAAGHSTLLVEWWEGWKGACRRSHGMQPLFFSIQLDLAEQVAFACCAQHVFLWSRDGVRSVPSS